ncbi:MAG: alpha/beta hydrolase family protein [Candidatus Sulfotelmatobacter sp.]
MGLLQRFSARPIIPGTHPIDVLVAWLTCGSKLFTQGWGDESLLADLSQHAAFGNPPPAICVDWHVTERWGGKVQRDGTFLSPLRSLPAKAMTVHVRACSETGNAAACVILAGSRDEGYAMRERAFGNVTSRGVDIYLLENPFYGRRRTTTASASLKTFSDHVLMNLGTIWEARALLEYLRGYYQKLTVAGYSMGGHMAAITAAVCPFPLACAALATGASAAPIYTQGLLSWSIDLNALAGESHLQSAASQRLRLLIEAADLTRHAPPMRSDAAVIVGCARDGYVLRSEIERLHEYWPGSILRWLSAGHVTGFITKRAILRDAVVDASERL